MRIIDEILRAWPFALVLSIGVPSLRAEEMPLPATLQSVMFKKIFAYDRSFQEHEDFRVLVVYSEQSPELDGILEAFGQVGVTAIGVRYSEIENEIATAAILYVLPGVDPSPLEPLCSEHGILSISGLPSLAEEGHVSVGLGKEEGRPRIVVNLGRAKSENHQFSADLLKLSKVVP